MFYQRVVLAKVPELSGLVEVLGHGGHFSATQQVGAQGHFYNSSGVLMCVLRKNYSFVYINIIYQVIIYRYQ